MTGHDPRHGPGAEAGHAQGSPHPSSAEAATERDPGAPAVEAGRDGRDDRAADLGELLRHAREAKGLELGDVAELTHVRREYLRALEEGRYEDLPEDVYTRNFVRLYAQAVGIDVARATDTYGRERRRAVGMTTLEERLEQERRGEPPPAPRGGPRVGTLLPTLLLVVVVVGLALWGFNSLLFRPARSVTQRPLTSPVPAPAAAASPSADAAAADAATPSAGAPTAAADAAAAPADAATSAAPGATAAPAGVVGGGPAEARTVLVSIHSEPAGASVSIDGFQLPGTTPIEEAPVTARAGRVLRVTLDGYLPVEQTVDLSADRTLDVALEPVAPPADAAAAPGSGAVGPAQIGITITERTWLEVYHSTQRNQGDRLVYATVDPGASYVFDLPVYLHVGNAAGVHLDLGGQDLGAMGSSGAVVGRAFPAP